MKIIKIIFIGLLALSLTVCGGIFIFFKTFDADQYLPQIMRKASLALGRPVFIGHADLDYSLRGITLDAGPVMIADDSGMIAQPFVKIDNARISLDTKSFIRFIRQRNLDDCSGSIIITSGVIENFDIIKTVVSHTAGVLVDMEGPLGKLGAQDIIIEKAETQFSLHDQTVFIDHFLMKTNIFEFTAKGRMDQGLNMDMQTVLRLNEDISGALVNELDGLKYLYDDSGRITIDAGLKGVLPHLKYKPTKDFRKKSKKFLIEEGGSFLKSLLK